MAFLVLPFYIHLCSRFDKSFHDMNSYAYDLMKVMKTSLTKHEFASALDMNANELFVQKMFRVVDKDEDGRISFQVATFKILHGTSILMKNLHKVLNSIALRK